ncbi:MAG: translation initiation factor IF-2 [Bacteroidia bacterium]|jgi:translation initiation factor IF-2
MAEGNIRIGKAAKELGVGMQTIVAFLNDNGHDDIKPNSKLTQEMYDLLLAEYQDDKEVKEAADKKTEVLQQKREELQAVAEQVKEDKIIRAGDSAKLEGVKSVGKIQLDSGKPDIEPTPKPTPEPEPVEEPKVVAEPTPEPQKEEKVEEPAPVVAEVEPVVETPKEVKAPVEEKAPVAEKPVTEEKAPAEVTATVEETPTETKPEEAKPAAVTPPKVEVREADTVIRAKAEKLTGPKTVGKIILPVEKPRKPKPVASSHDTEAGKRKRKRVVRPAAGAAVSKDRPKPGVARGRRLPAAPLTDEQISKQIKETLARLQGTKKSKASKYRREKRDMVQERIAQENVDAEAEKKVLKVTEFVSANELATMMDVAVTEIISACMSLGLFVSINQRLDAETLTIVAEEFGYETEFISAEVQSAIVEVADDPDSLQERSPIVTVMGHVDHGKTSLLDHIRKANVIAGEAGGITQHIGAYSVELDSGRKITFLDTPGHEAFTAMRARGAQVTDIVIVVVAADDSVMPQTKEAINHAQAAGVPIIIAINKVDRDVANPDKIKEELSQLNVLVEDWGGEYMSEDISAKTGLNVDKLLEKVLVLADLQEMKANPDKNGNGTVIESELDKGRGYVSTILVQSGTVKIGDVLLGGCYSGRVKALFNERGGTIEEAGPATPCQVLGLNGAPQAGDKFNVMDDEKEAKAIATKRMQLQREQGIRTQKHITLDEIGRRLAIGDFQELNVIIKGDVDGSVEALADSLTKLSTEKIAVKVIMQGVGGISESDVLLASASDAIIIGFQVRPSVSARKLAELEQIDVRLYSIIYDAIDELKAAMEGMLAPEFEEKVTCNVEIREVFKISKAGSIAGCMVIDGKVSRGSTIRLIRDGIVVYDGVLSSLKRFKDDAKEVAKGFECGMSIDKFNDIKVGDIIEGYEQVEIKAKL